MPTQKRSGEVSITHYQALNFKESGTITGRPRGIDKQDKYFKEVEVGYDSVKLVKLKLN